MGYDSETGTFDLTAHAGNIAVMWYDVNIFERKCLSPDGKVRIMIDHAQYTMRKWGWRMLVFLEWAIALWLLLEFVEAGRAFIAERAYRDYFNAQNSKVYGMVPAEVLDAPENKFIPERASVDFVRNNPSSDTVTETDDADACLDMVMRGEMRALFDAQGALLESCGEPMIEKDLQRYLAGYAAHGAWDKIIHAIRSGETPLQTQCALTWGVPVHYAITLTKREDLSPACYEVTARDINDQVPLEALHYAEVPGPESPWEITFFKYKKNWSMPDNTILQTNEHGFRDHAITLPKPEGVYRIVCIGGSTTEEGNATDTTYPKMTERKLAERFGEGRVEVINAGICAINTYGIRRRFEDYLALDPDLILFYGGVNDTCHLHFQFWLETVPPWKKWARTSFILRQYFGFYLLPDAAALADYIRDTTFRNLRAMRYAARQKGVDMAWTSFAYPTLRFYHFRARNYYDVNMRDVWQGQGIINFRTYCRIIDLLNKTGSAIAAEEGIPWLPVAEHFRAGADHFFDVCHMTPVGLELKSNIFSALISEYLSRTGEVPADNL